MSVQPEMARYTRAVLPLLLLSCTGSQTIGGDSDSGGVDSPTAPVDTGEAPRDLDEDGYPAGEDCMDLNAEVHPGATEIWNELDDDCDGRFDADGTWSGTTAVEAQAVYEGRRYSFSLECPLEGERGSGQFEWLVTCTTDTDDEMAQRLLGAVFTLRPEEAVVELQTWSGKAIVESDTGWDTSASATITWSTFDRAALSGSLSAASLSMTIAGNISRH